MAEVMPVAAEWLEYEESGDDVLVHDRQRQKIHVLNRSAAAILRACDGQTTVDTVAASMGAPQGYDVRSDIASMLAAFAQLGLTGA